jgi:hypothetical protein
VPKQQWNGAFRIKRHEILHVHLIDLVFAVWIDARRRAAWRELYLLYGLAADGD